LLSLIFCFGAAVWDLHTGPVCVRLQSMSATGFLFSNAAKAGKQEHHRQKQKQEHQQLFIMSETLGENRKTQRELHQCGFSHPMHSRFDSLAIFLFPIGICNHARICVQ